MLHAHPIYTIFCSKMHTRFKPDTLVPGVLDFQASSFRLLYYTSAANFKFTFNLKIGSLPLSTSWYIIEWKTTSIRNLARKLFVRGYLVNYAIAFTTRVDKLYSNKVEHLSRQNLSATFNPFLNLSEF